MSELNGLWAFRFEDFEQLGVRNGGAIVILGTRLYGGDGHFYYQGEMQRNGPQIVGTGSITHYSGRSLSAYGIMVDEKLEIEFDSRVENDRIVGHMWPAGQERPMLGYTMERLVDLS